MLTLKNYVMPATMRPNCHALPYTTHCAGAGSSQDAAKTLGWIKREWWLRVADQWGSVYTR